MRTFDAQELARVQLQKGRRAKVKAYEIAVMLAEKEGVPVVHNGGEL